MKALYIGYSKCGTKTMGQVFRTLGYKCYDFPENLVLLGEDWTKIIKHGTTSNDFIRMYKGVDCSDDFPVYFFWEEFLEAFPDIKLLVSYRDEEEWLESFQRHTEKVQNDNAFQILTMLSITAQKLVRTIRLIERHVWGSCTKAWPWQIMIGINPTLLLQRYRKHNLHIKEEAPKDQLHVVDFTKGWKPICEFLGEPVPDIPFPHSNKAGQILKESMETHPIFHQMNREARNNIIILLFTCALLFYLFLM